MSEEQKAQVISGNNIAKTVRTQLAEKVASLKAQNVSRLPSLAVVLVGDRKDSQTYVNMKTKACEEVGIVAHQYDLPAATSQEDLSALITKLNDDETVDGILVQLPLPAHLNSDAIIAQIKADKDVDGLTTPNAGDLARNGDKAHLIPCTPLGSLRLLDEMKVEIAGKQCVVVGRSNLVGKPMANLLLSRDGTVTVCHSKTKDLPSVVKQADIVIAAVGRANFVKGDWLKPGCVVIDVGINAVDDSTKKAGYRLVGDVDYEAASKVAGMITPVPGGVGPMTVAMLLHNTIKAYFLHNPNLKQN